MRGLRLAFVTLFGLVASVGMAGAGTLNVTPDGHNFGLQPVFGTTATATLVLTSSGTDTEIRGYSLGAGCSEFTVQSIHPSNSMPVSGTNPFDLDTMGGDSSLDINLTYDPANRTADSCVVTILFDDATGETSFTIQGDGSAAELTITPATHDFGNSRVNTSVAVPTQSFTITNIGELAATVTRSITVGGTAYSVPGGTINVGGGNGTGTAVVTFDVQAPGPANGTLQVTAPNSVNTPTASLMGTGTIANLEYPGDPFNLGSAAVGGSITTGVQLSNALPDATTTLSITSLTLNNTQFAFTDHGCSGQACTPGANSIAAGASDTYNIRCSPTGTGGLRTALLTVVSNDFDPATPNQNQTTSSITLDCTGAPTIVNTTPGAFPNTRVGTPSAPLSFNVSNPAGAASYTFTASVTGDFALACAGGGTACFTGRTVTGGETVPVQVIFTPTVVGPRSGTVTITSAQAANSPVTFGVSGTGIQPTISVPGTLGFGNVPVLLAGGATQSITISNTGTDTLTIPSMAITGTTDISFAFGSCTSGQSCATPISIGAGMNTGSTVVLRCDPSATGARNGTLTITSDSNSPTATTNTPVSLTCNGTQPNTMVSTTSLTFGPQRVGTASPTQTFTVSNPSGGTVGATTYTISSSAPAEFTISCSAPGCTGTLNPGTTVTVTAGFTPAALGTRTGTITISTPQDATVTRTVSVTGEGVQPEITLVMPTPAVPPTGGGALTFTGVQPNQTSAAQTIQIRNTGTQTLSITQVTNSNPTDFDLSAGGTGNVAVNGTQMWTVACDPETLGTGTKTGTITIVNDSANDTSVDIALTCTVIEGRISITAVTAPTTLSAGPPQTINFLNVIVGQMRTTTVTIRNDGNQPVMITNIMLGAADQGFTVGTPSATTVTPSGGTITVPLTFMPTNQLQGATTLTITSNWNTIVANVVGDGQGVGVNISPTPTPPATAIDLGDVQWDATRAQLFTISNNAEAAAPITGATLLNNAGGNFTLSGFTAGTLNNGQMTTLTVTATPNDTMLGTFTATLEITVNLPAPNDRLRVDLTYRSTGPGIELMPSSMVDFGAVDVDQTGGRVLPVTIRNSGNGVLPIASVGNITGPGAAAFTKTPIAPTGSLMPNATATIMVTYDPSVERSMSSPDTAEFVINSGVYFVNGVAQPAGQRITLSGWGIDRHIAVRGDGDQPTLAFGDVYRNPKADDARARKVVRVCNTGEATLDVTMLTDPAAPFMITSADAFTVAGRPGAVGTETCQDVTVEFRPDAYGDYSSSLAVMNNDNTSAQTMLAQVTLSGRGIPRPVVVTPGSLTDRPRIAMGVPVRLSEILPGAITAMNPDTDETFAVELTLTDASGSTMVIGAATDSLAPGASDSYDLEFVARTEGNFTVTVDVFLDEDPESHHTVTLDLEGVDVSVRGGGGCDAGGGRAGWLALVLAVLGLGAVRGRGRARRGRALARVSTGLAAVLAVTAGASTARAQETGRDVDISTFHVSPATETAMFNLDTPYLAERGAWALGLSFNHAVKPLTAEGQAVVNARTQAELGFAYTVIDRLELGARLPIVQQSGETDMSERIFGVKAVESGTAIGDVAIAAKFALIAKPNLGLALVGEATVPTGKDDRFAGARTATGAGRLLLGAAAGKRLAFTANAGFVGRGETRYADLAQGNAIVFGAGVSLRAAEKLWVIGEAFGEMGLAGGDDNVSAEASRPLEGALGVRYRLGRSTSIAAGGGAGLLPGAGSPVARGFLMIVVSPKARPDVELNPYIPPPPKDMGDDDGDKVVNADDACKLDAEDADGHQDADGCPDADNDGDGMLDADDKCANEPEDKDGFEDGDGCIDRDNDADKVLDVDDKCPAEPEDEDGFEDGDGCEEADNDKDGVPDVLDTCAMEPETINGNADEDGCPDKGDSVIMVMPDRIEVLEPITFQGVTTKLGKNAPKTLAQIGATLRADRKIKRIRITVHVHPRGADDQKLSDKRAEEIRNWLVNWGVEPERLDAKGIGSKRPLVPKNAKGADQINDRVELIIFERD